MSLNYHLILAGVTLALTSCGTIKPNDKLQKIIDGGSSAQKSSPANDKLREDHIRESERLMPRKEERKGLGLKMEF